MLRDQSCNHNCKKNKTLNSIENTTTIEQDARTHCCGNIHIMTRPLRSHARHRTIYSTLRHVTKSHQDLLCSEAAASPRRANAESHPSPHQRSWRRLLAHTFPFEALPIHTATLALVILLEQRYKLEYAFLFSEIFVLPLLSSISPSLVLLILSRLQILVLQPPTTHSVRL